MQTADPENAHANPDIEEKVRETLAKQLDVLPDEFDLLHQYLKTSRTMLKYHYSENSLHFDDDTQTLIARLVANSDYLTCEFARLEYQCRCWCVQAEKDLRTNRTFQTEKKELETFQADFRRLKNQAHEQAKQTLQLLQKMGNSMK
ncbi:MAG: hypothetical protein Q7R47_05855 [Candidatus Diapherotrites archaeon]|nr:hypothetical protein [Candidatus Diapherotrites archaeon]